MQRVRVRLAWLIAAQAAHSIEECVGRLWESFAPARFVAGLLSEDLQRGFIIANVVIVVFGVWCCLWPVRHQSTGAVSLAWFWVALELINGLVHSLRSLLVLGYTPGLATAPLLIGFAASLAYQLRRDFPVER